MTHVWEAAKFDDACTVPTPCLLLSDGHIISCDERLVKTDLLVLPCVFKCKTVLELLKSASVMIYYCCSEGSWWFNYQ